MSGQIPPLSVDTASQIAQFDSALNQNREPGFANTYGPGADSSGGLVSAAIPLSAVGALGLWALYNRYQQDLADRESEKLAAIDLNAFKAQLPGLHLKDMLLGAALGGGAGLLYDQFAGPGEKHKRTQTTLGRLLTGAAIGAGGANIVGDRVRRYISNSKLPFGYDSDNILSQLTPRSWKHFYDAAIADKPSYDPAKVKELTSRFGGNEQVRDTALGARRELERRSFGVHSENAQTDYWQRNKGKAGPEYLSANEKNPDYASILPRLFLPSQLSPAAPMSYKDYLETVPAGEQPISREKFEAIRQREAGGRDIAPLFTSPLAALGVLNNNNWRNADMFGANTLLGEQQVIARPRDGKIDGRVLDRFDVTPSQDDTTRLMAAIKNLDILKPSWYGQKLPQGFSSYQEGATNKSWLSSLLGRLVWDKMLVEKQPWVSQRFQFVPENGSNSLQFLNEAGRGATSPMSSQQLSDYLAELQAGQQ